MADKEKLRIAVDTLEEELAEQLRAAGETKKIINALYVRMGENAPYTDVDAPTAGAKGAVKPDQFANAANPAEATKQYLRWRGQDAGATPIAEVFEAIKKGGFRFTGKDAEAGMRVSIGKDRQLVRFPETDTVGLTEWYPRRRAPTVDKNGKAEKGENNTEAADDADAEEETGAPEPAPPAMAKSLFDK